MRVLGLFDGVGPCSVLIGRAGGWLRVVVVVMRLVTAQRVLAGSRCSDSRGRRGRSESSVQRLSLTASSGCHGDVILPIMPLGVVVVGAGREGRVI